MRSIERLHNFSLVIFSLIFLLLVLEGVFQLFYTPPVRPTGYVKGLRTAKSHLMDDELGWVPKKNIEGHHAKPPIFDSTFHTNSLGLRDKEYSLEKPAGKTRIVVIGDSFTWGYGVNDPHVFPEVLERRLPNTEVINLGVTGYGIPQEFEYLKRLGIQFNPDIVLLAFCLNDFMTPYWKVKPRVARDEQGNKVLTEWQVAQKPTEPVEKTQFNIYLWLKGYLKHHSSLYAFVIDKINTSKPLVRLLISMGVKEKLSGIETLDMELRPALKVYSENLKKKVKATKEKLLEVQMWLKKNGIRFIVIAIPSVEAVDEVRFQRAIAYKPFEVNDFDLDKPYRLLEDFCNKHGIEIVNPLTTFRAVHDLGNQLFFNGDPHFNEEGHELFGEEIKSYLQTSLTFLGN